MDQLNLPHCDFEFGTKEGKDMILDPVRRKFVRLTPEEWVRQHFAQYLIRERGFPAALMAIEKGFLYQGMLRRADIVAYDRRGSALLMVECKAPGVDVTQETFDQVAGYNMVIGARYLVVTNGHSHYCCEIDKETSSYEFLDEIPLFEQI